MAKNGASLLVHALEQIGVEVVFGVPGVHNIEIFKEVMFSRYIEPVIATHELSAGYMADAISRTTKSIGVLIISPGSGLTNALTAITNSYLSSVPIIVISGGIDKKNEKNFLMNDIDMQQISSNVVKKYVYVDNVQNVLSSVYDVYTVANSGEPGPVIIEIPLKIQKANENKINLLSYKKYKDLNDKSITKTKQYNAEDKIIKLACELLSSASKPGICVGWGAMHALEQVERISELLAAPVCTTMQGINAFSFNHPLHTGIGYVANSSPIAQKFFENCDCLLAIGMKFSDSNSKNFTTKVPETLIHIDISSEVFNKNFQSKLCIAGDSKIILTHIIENLDNMAFDFSKTKDELISQIAKEKEKYRKTWFENLGENIVTPGFFFNALRKHFPKDTIVVADDGKHTLLSAELFPMGNEGTLICPTNYSAIGYGISGAIAAKFENRNKTVISIINDGALLVCGNELLTAYTKKLGILFFVFRNKKNIEHKNNKLETISHRPSSSSIDILDIEYFAKAVKAEYIKLTTDIDITGAIEKSKTFLSRNKSVLIEVELDYSIKSHMFTRSFQLKSSRLSLTDRLKMFFKI